MNTIVVIPIMSPVALDHVCEHSSSASTSSSTSSISRFDSSSTFTQRQHSHKRMVRNRCTFSVRQAAQTPWLESSDGVQQTAEQLLAGVQLQQCIQQPGHLPLASLTIPLLQQLSDHVSSFQKQFVQSGHCHQADHTQGHPHKDPSSAHHHHQQQQQQHFVQPDRLAPLFTLSEYTKQGKGSSSKHDLPPDRNKLRTRGSGENPASQPGTLCVETDAGGRQRVYRTRSGVDKGSGKMWEGFDMVDDPQTHQGRISALVRSYLLPQGFPDSVAPQYATYMGWRGVQYFFGGAMSVFTTKCLLTSLGVAGRHSGEAAAAINWVLKDGAGRLGRFLFARWGRELDCELKQFRLAGDLLMEAGAALELSTIMAPHAFLPLACSANLAKNLAAVAASSTRAPIYRTFALQNNLADITAKGESVANLADILGTLAGILLSKWKLPMVPTFVALSCGYLLASRREVDSVELPYLNRARLALTSTHFLKTGVVPGVPEANHNEPLLPWGRYHQGRVVLGSRVEAACATPADLHHAAALYKQEKFVVCYRPDKKKVHILLRQGAGPTDCLKAAFSAHVFLHMLDEEQEQQAQKQPALGASSSSSSSATSSSSSSSSSSGLLGGRLSSSTSSQAVGSSSTADAAGSGSKGRWPWGRRKAAQQPAAEAAAAAAAPPLMGADLVRETWNKLAIALPWGQDPGADYYRRLIERSKCAVDTLYSDFSRQAEKQGWKLAQTMLNPKESRVMRLTPLSA